MRLNFLLKGYSFLLVPVILFTANLHAQVTTATLSGIVKDPKGTALAAATVLLEFPDAGIRQTVITKSDGRFTITNLRVGGPYKITVTHVSYQQSAATDVFLELGQNNTIEFLMKEKSGVLEEVTVTGSSRIFDNKRTGASTNINNRLIKALPTISRSADDYLRITPSASATYNGLSFAGRNGQFNNFSLDGAVFNNPFGLDAPTPGGQTNAQPVSLDAIDQIQVNIAPYDVTQAGFTGAGVNTVTKSGSNNFTGTVYAFYRNQDLSGKKVDKNKIVVPELDQLQAGFALGGAIKKNKAFYFVNFETEQRKDQPTSYVARNANNANNTNTSRVLEADLIAVSSILKQRFNYETGPYQGFTYDQKNYKWLTKFDWNIDAIHKLSFTYNGLNAIKGKPAHPSAIRRRGPDYTTLQYKNSGYEIQNILHSFGAELKSNWQGNYANKLRVVYSVFRDRRNPFSAPFPVLNITKNGTMYIAAGHEPFSIHNRLTQDALQITDNFNVFAKNHTLTFGASYESFKFGNSFNLVGYGPALFSDADIQTFKDSVPTGGAYVFGAYPLDVDVTAAGAAAQADKWAWYYLTVGQISAYAQDEWQVTDKFRLTYGIRADVPQYFNARYVAPDGSTSKPTVQNNDNLTLFDKDGKPVTNGAGKQLDNTKFPDKKILFSPRVGFNWDVKGDKTVQIRGGSGLFTGRFPFVWIGNQIGNPFSFFYCVTDRDFKWPQVWRTNLGADIKANWGTVFTADVAYTKDINAMIVRNYALGTPTGTLNSGTGDQRKVYQNSDKGTANTYVFTNTSAGYQFNISLQAQHSFKNGWYLMAAYNFLIAKDASSVSAEISSDAFDRNPILNNANQAIESNSLYGNKNRFIAAATKKFEYGQDKKYATTISLFGSWTSGNRFAFVYGGDINNDGTGSNDLLYIPTDAEIDAMTFTPLTDVNGNIQSAASQKAAYKAFIAQDDYLSGRRGKHAEKYASENPWFSQVDMRILQDFNFKNGKKRQTIQLSLDLINLGNLISSKWGVYKYATTSGYFQPISVSYNNNAPTYQFDPSIKSTFTSSPDIISRWQLQFGLRYIF
ncbi:MAG TPA: carboxypeptidase regulatory-like domain-containing protein [Chitinophagaceae bacterium]|nr:carboxypeptidase regulatory-like domain-containing protein [Chitinophagaceae bacterium]